ncbi:hypothetical protein ACXWYY_002983 [Enterobacter hormaechei]|nr:hypothetical protein [Enterobacter hormaechei]
MKHSAAIEIIDMARLAGLDLEATARIRNVRIHIKTYWQQPKNRIRQSNLDRQRAVPRLIQALYANGIKSTVISRFTRLSARQVQLLIAKEL